MPLFTRVTHLTFENVEVIEADTLAKAKAVPIKDDYYQKVIAETVINVVPFPKNITTTAEAHDELCSLGYF